MKLNEKDQQNKQTYNSSVVLIQSCLFLSLNLYLFISKKNYYLTIRFITILFIWHLSTDFPGPLSYIFRALWLFLTLFFTLMLLPKSRFYFVQVRQTGNVCLFALHVFSASGVFVDSLLRLKLLQCTSPHLADTSTSLHIVYWNLIEEVQSLIHSCMSLLGRHKVLYVNVHHCEYVFKHAVYLKLQTLIHSHMWLSRVRLK